MKLIAATLAAATLACTAVAFAQPRLQTPPQLNAAESQDRSVKTQKGDASVPEYKAPEAMPLECELQSDAFEQGQTVTNARPAPDCARGANGAAITHTPQQASDPRPPRVGILWGGNRPIFHGVIGEIGTKYTLHQSEGEPTRATTDADAQQKQKGEDPPSDSQSDPQR